MDIMEGLLGPGRSAPGGPAGEWGEDGKEPQQDEAATSPDPGLLSYLDELCSQEDFITKVRWPAAWCLEDSRDWHSNAQFGAEPRPLALSAFLVPGLCAHVCVHPCVLATCVQACVYTAVRAGVRTHVDVCAHMPKHRVCVFVCVCACAYPCVCA